MTDNDQQARIDRSRIFLTHTAKSKCFRLFSEYEIVEKVSTMDGELWRERATGEYHLKAPGDNRVIVIADEGEELVVITQMHRHIHYHRNEDFELVSPADKPTPLDRWIRNAA